MNRLLVCLVMLALSSCNHRLTWDNFHAANDLCKKYDGTKLQYIRVYSVDPNTLYIVCQDKIRFDMNLRTNKPGSMIFNNIQSLEESDRVTQP